MSSIMFVSCMFVLKYSFNIVFINIYYSMLQCQNILPSKIKNNSYNYKLFYLEDRYFSPSLVYSPAVLFSEKYIFSSAEKIELIQ